MPQSDLAELERERGIENEPEFYDPTDMSGTEYSRDEACIPTDFDRCADCGLLTCECNHETQTEKTMSEKLITDFLLLKKLKNNAVIHNIEGVLRDLYEPECRNEQYGDTQNGVLVDNQGEEHRCSFTEEACLEVKTMRGKRMRFASTKSKKGTFTGVKMKVTTNKSTGKVYRSIHITPTSKREVMQNTQSKTAEPAPASGAAKKNGAEKKTTAVRKKEPADESDPATHNARTRIYADLKLVSLYRKGYLALKDELDLPAFSDEDIRLGAARIAMGYKGQYGVYAPPIFGPHDFDKKKSRSTENETEAKAPPKVSTGDPAVEDSGWKAFVHPSGKTLGELFEKERAKFYDYILWAYGFKGGQKKSKAFQAAVLLGAAELNITPKTMLNDRVAEFEGTVLDEYARTTYGVSWGELTDGDALQIIAQEPDLTDQLEKLNTQPEEEEDGIPE